MLNNKLVAGSNDPWKKLAAIVSDPVKSEKLDYNLRERNRIKTTREYDAQVDVHLEPMKGHIDIYLKPRINN